MGTLGELYTYRPLTTIEPIPFCLYLDRQSVTVVGHREFGQTGGGENVVVAKAMLGVRGTGRRCHLVGSSVHN